MTRMMVRLAKRCGFDLNQIVFWEHIENEDKVVVYFVGVGIPFHFCGDDASRLLVLLTQSGLNIIPPEKKSGTDE